MRKIIVATGAVALALAIAAPASAHVTANPNEGPAGGFFKTDFRVGHGCDGSPTTEVSVEIPGNVTSVHPQQVAGWNIETRMGELDEPIESEGETITEGIREVTWTAEEPLPDAHMQEFGVSMALPEGESGEPLWFPFVQSCEEGEHAWIEVPDSVEEWGDLDEPAPYVVLGAGEEGGEEESAAADGTAMGEDEIRSIAAEEASDTEPSNALALLGVILGAIGIAFGITANLRARKSVK